ncbi:MAG TPA: hypothetical protein VHW90_03160 [Stellaceae bacterium]|jgi:hypothetical protein|nr:hypothetical protein [Stellaceae bacterium]
MITSAITPAPRRTRAGPELPPPAPPTRPAATAASIPEFAVRLVPLEPGFYAFGMVGEISLRRPAIGLPLPAIHVGAAPEAAGEVEISDGFGGQGCWLGGGQNMLFVKTPTGGAVLVTGYLSRDPASTALELAIRRIDPAAWPTIDGKEAVSARTLAPPVTLRLSGGSAEEQSAAARQHLEVVAHIRGRGDLRFIDQPWVGRLGAGAWIEAFTVIPRSEWAAAGIEYKGLTGSGTETPWLGSGLSCGTRGMSIPLLGFAVRQKGLSADALFDCEYSGYFQSGRTVGPVRNGVPCRSPVANDPLEGLQLRVTPRRRPPARQTSE